MPPRAKSDEEAQKVIDKAMQDLNIAFGAGIRVAKVLAEVTIRPKVELAKKVLRALIDDEGK